MPGAGRDRYGDRIDWDSVAVESCHRPKPVVDLASEIDLPVGVVRVLLGDLIDEGLLRVLPAQRKPHTDQRLLRMVLDGLQSL